MFRYLDEKAFNHKLRMDGIDFRCLFLAPNLDEVKRAHKQQGIFVPELNSSILRAKSAISGNEKLKNTFVFTQIEEIIIRLDNCILYSRPVFDVRGVPQLLTNTGFEVFSVKTEKGEECIRKYEKIWNAARQMF